MDARDDSFPLSLRFAALILAAAAAAGTASAAESTRLLGSQTTVASQLNSGKVTTRPSECILLEVKFDDRWRVRLVSGKPASVGTKTFSSQTASVLAALPVVAWQRLFTSLPTATVDDVVAKAEEHSGQKLADLNNYHTACVAQRDVKTVLAALNDPKRSEIDVAMLLPRRAPLPLAPDFSDPANPTGLAQYYLWAPDFNGLGVEQAWADTGVKGANVKVTDVEYDFLPKHVELDGRVNLGGPTPPFLVSNYAFHGTASLGVIGALDNLIDGQGTTGIAPEVDLRFNSVKPLRFDRVNVADTVLASATGAGDILVIEQQTARWLGIESDDPDDQFGLVPSEWEPAVYDAVRTVSALGMIVVAAAGNGSQNLDLIINGADSGYSLNAPPPDSGAIIVGAGWPGIVEVGKTKPEGRMRPGWSNFGSRVDVQGWGAGVLAPGYSHVFMDGDFDSAYGLYSGTSSATALVAGVVALLQSNFKSMMGFPASADEMKFLLKVTGQPQVWEDQDHIGPLPNAIGALDFLQGTLPAPVFECTQCGAVQGSSSDFPEPRFDPIPTAHQLVQPVSVGVGFGLNPHYAKILFTVDGSEPDALGRDSASGGNGAFGQPGDTVFVPDGRTLRARAVLDVDASATPDWAPTVGPDATLVLGGHPPLASGTTVYLLPTGNRELSNTEILFTTNGTDPDEEGLGYGDGGVGYSVGPNGVAVALTSSAVFKARSYMRGLCFPDAEDPDDSECGPGERPRSKVVSGAYSVIDGTVAAPTFSLTNYQNYASGTTLTISPPAAQPNAQVWVSMVPAGDLFPGEPYPNGPHSFLYSGPVLLVPDATGQCHVQARAYAHTVSAEVQSASEMAWGHYFVTP